LQIFLCVFVWLFILFFVCLFVCAHLFLSPHWFLWVSSCSCFVSFTSVS
jgi:hypothetical protein